MPRLLVAGLVGFAVTVAVAAHAQGVPERRLDLAFHDDGTVTLGARNVSPREILLEWRRQCGCEVINAEQVPGGAIMLPLQFDRADQRVVLQSLLRQAAGYVLTPKPEDSTAASDFGAIYILATSSAVAGGGYLPPPLTPSIQPPTTGSPDDEIPPIVPFAEGADGQVPAPARFTPPPGTSPFGSRTYNPFTTTPQPGNRPGMTPAPAAPGTTAPVPGQAPAPNPAAPPPGQSFPRCTVVPIVAVPPDGD